MDGRKALAIAGLLIALATALGAFGAHAFKAHVPQDRLQIYETGVRYQFLNALGLVAIGILLRSVDSDWLRWSAVLVLAGIILFSGSLYLLTFGLTFGAPRVVGILTPIGGLALLAGWLLFAVAVSKQ